MAIFHANTGHVQRSKGASAVGRAAYQSGACLTDERTGEVYDYTRRGGVESSEIYMPDDKTLDAEKSAELWNVAEAAEARKDARTARQWECSIPHELSKRQRQGLVKEHATWFSRTYGIAVQASIHEPSRRGDQRNWHAHFLMSTRRVSQDENGKIVMAEKSAHELDNKQRQALGLPRSQDELKANRERWADLCNTFLECAQVSERVDHRSHEERGIDAEPTKHLGPYATAMQRMGRLELIREVHPEEIPHYQADLEENLPPADRHELTEVRESLAEARRELKSLSMSRSSVSSLMERFRESQQRHEVRSEQRSDGFLAHFRAEREERSQEGTDRAPAQQHSQEREHEK